MFLLDVNALIAWEHPTAQGHEAFHAWRAAHPAAPLLSCALTELGFIRVSMQAFAYSAPQAEQALVRRLRPFLRHVSALPRPALPDWATTAAKTTDGYLAQVANTHGAQLATFDTGIPGATLIGS